MGKLQYLSTVVCSQCRSRKKCLRLLLLTQEISSSGKHRVCLLCINKPNDAHRCMSCHRRCMVLLSTVYSVFGSGCLDLTLFSTVMVWKEQEFSGNRALNLGFGSSFLDRLYSRVSYHTHLSR